MSERSNRIMLVEDSASQATRLIYILQHEGWEVTWAATADEAFTQLRTAKPDLVLLDFYLPGMRGDEVCRRIRMNIDSRNLPIIILTAEDANETELRGLESGADDFVVKSADPDVLLLRIRTLLQKVRKQSDILSAPESSYRSARLLAIDDSVTFLERLRPELESEGYEVECSYDGPEGLERIAKEQFDGVIIDLIMPGIDGIEVCRRIDELRKHLESPLVTVMLTGHESKEDLSRALEAGADDFVGKSSDISVLKGRIRALLRRKFFEEENRNILKELRAKELEALRERAAKEAAEARAALAEELQKTTEELKRSQAELRQANQAKDHFMAILSHELRTPLTPVLAVVSGRDTDPNLPPDLREDLAMIRRNIELEARLIDDLLDLTRITQGKLEIRCASINMRQVVEHALEICKPPGDNSGGPAIVDDFRATECTVWGDSSRLSQVLWNLIRNAVKFTPADGRITISSFNVPQAEDPTQQCLIIEVTDTGIGIEKEMLPRIFDAFEQGGRQITRQFGGLGLGLAISKAIVELHQGSLTVHSDGKGKGATFRLALPLTTVPEAAALVLPACAPASSLPRESTGPRPLHILLVEDHPDTSVTLQRLLIRRGHRVTSAISVATAVEAASAGESFDLLISDLGLPDGTGLDVIREVSERQPITGIALTGFGMEEDIRKSYEAGFRVHLTKPVDIAALDAAIADLANRRSWALASA